MKTKDAPSKRRRGRVIRDRFAGDVAPVPPDPAGGSTVVEPGRLGRARQDVADPDRIIPVVQARLTRPASMTIVKAGWTPETGSVHDTTV